MPRSRHPFPSYVRHGQSGRGRLVWTDPLGLLHQKLLPGPFGSAESLSAKARLELELASSPAAPAVDPEELTVAEVLAAYLDFAERHYADRDGRPTDEVRHLKTTIRHVRELYGGIPIREFGPLALKAVRQKFVERKWSRKTINARVERIRRVIKWGVAEELVPPTVYQALSAVSGLQRGRTPARETDPIRPVDDAVVDATLDHLNRHVRGLVQFQRLTGCRPGEACSIRRCDIDRSGTVWIYRPADHKTAWKGKTRSIAIGPRAQELLREFFTTEGGDYLFSPRMAVEEGIAARSAQRRTPLWPSHVSRNASKRIGQDRKRPPAERYNRLGYLTAITRACDRAFALPPEIGPRRKENGKSESRREWWSRLGQEAKEEVKRWRKAHHWHPNQLRHAFATKVRRAHGLEAAQVLLGHSRADVTEIYAERDDSLAGAVATALG